MLTKFKELNVLFGFDPALMNFTAVSCEGGRGGGGGLPYLNPLPAYGPPCATHHRSREFQNRPWNGTNRLMCLYRGFALLACGRNRLFRCVLPGDRSGDSLQRSGSDVDF